MNVSFDRCFVISFRSLETGKVPRLMLKLLLESLVFETSWRADISGVVIGRLSALRVKVVVLLEAKIKDVRVE